MFLDCGALGIISQKFRLGRLRSVKASVVDGFWPVPNVEDQAELVSHVRELYLQALQSVGTRR